MDINANVIPFIGGEEEKMEPETQKILGDFVDGDRIEPLAAKVSAHCNRVPVVDGHTVLRLGRTRARSPASTRSAQAFDSFTQRAAAAQPAERAAAPGHLYGAGRPSAAAQRRRARERDGGLRRPPARVPGARLQVRRLGHNTVRGAAGAAVLNAELMHSEGMLD